MADADGRTWLAVAAGAALGTAVVARLHHARRLAQSTGQGADLRVEDGVCLYTQSGGRPDADLTVVLVHGFSSRLEGFRDQVSELAREARVVAYDQRGHGRSGWGGRRSATLKRLGLDLAQVLEQRTTGPVVLVGHSMGGMVIMALSLRRPDLVRDRVMGVGLLSTSSGGLTRTVLPQRLADALEGTWLARGLLLIHWFVAPALDRARALRWSPVRRRLHRQMFGSRPRTRDEEQLLDSMWSSTHRSVTSALLPALATHDRRDALDTLGGRPALVLTGTEDETIPPSHSRVIADALGADARLVEVPGAGHMVTMTAADEVNRELSDLLARAREHLAARRGSLRHSRV